MFPGGQSYVDFCWSDTAEKDESGDDVDVSRCMFKKKGTIFNCNGHFRYSLPSVTWNDIHNAVKYSGKTWYIKFGEIDLSQAQEKQRRRALLGNTPDPPIGLPYIRCEWGDLGSSLNAPKGDYGDATGRSWKHQRFNNGGEGSNVKYDEYHHDIKNWGYIVSSQGRGNKLVMNWLKCGIYDHIEEGCDGACDDPMIEGKENAMAGLVPYYTFKIRFVMKYCVDNNWKNNEQRCCANGMAGRFCIFVNDSPKQHYDQGNYDRYNTKLLLNGAKPCDFGYCTDGDLPSKLPPPPPPFKLPPMPKKPPVPPGKSSTSQDYADYSEYTPPFPAPPPPSPPPLKAQYQTRSSSCMEKTESFDIANLFGHKGKCDPGNNEVIAGFWYDSCEIEFKNKTTVGVVMRTRCASLEALYDDEKGTCNRHDTDPFIVSGESMGVLEGFPMHCPENQAMQYWSFREDPRAWYVRRNNPGGAMLSMDCCDAPHLHHCSKRSSSCVKNDGSMIAKMMEPERAECNLMNEEVVTGWKVTSDDCPKGYAKVETTCCSTSRPSYTGASDKRYDESTAETARMIVEDEEIVNKNQPDYQEPPPVGGPLFDSIVVQEGASNVDADAVYSGKKNWAEAAHTSIPGDSTCKRKLDSAAAGDLSEALKTCSALGVVSDVQKHDGNKFLKASVTVGISFEGAWGIRAVSRAFTGALVVTHVQSGVEQVVATVDLEPMMAMESQGATSGNLRKAEAYFMSVAGLYKFSFYGAYDTEGDMAALKDSDPSTRPDALLFKQFSHCDARMWTVLNAVNLDQCLAPEEEAAVTTQAASSTALTEKGKMKLPNLDFDGAFLSLKLSMDLMASYFIFQGVFSFLGRTITLDVNIKPGKAEDGGGIHINFKFEWRAGPVFIGSIEGYMGVAPLDLEALIGGDFSALLDVKFMLSVSIKPNFLNLIIMVVEFAIKIVLKIVLMILLIVIEIAQIALEIAMVIVETAQKAVNFAQRSLNAVQRMVNKRADAKRAEENNYVKMEWTNANVLDPLVQRGEEFCEEKLEGHGRDGCYSVNGRRSCMFSMIGTGSLPDNCRQFIANAKNKINEYNGICCGFWKRISRAIQVVLTEVLVMVLLLLLLIPKVILKVAEIILFAVMAVLKLAEAAIHAAIKAIGSFGDMGRVLNKKNRVIKKKFMR
jgi:hypothetical protein